MGCRMYKIPEWQMDEVVGNRAKTSDSGCSDPVNHPDHYTSGEVECIEAIKSALSPEEYRGYLRGTMMKYTWRAPHKGAYRQDLEKAAWYSARLAEEVDKPKNQCDGCQRGLTKISGIHVAPEGYMACTANRYGRE